MILITSDVHVHPDEAERTQRFVEFIRRAASGPAARAIYLLGDVFDVWIGPRQPRSPEVVGVFEALGAAVAGGVDVSFIPGNRDFHLDRRALAGIGVRRLGDGHRLDTPAGRVWLTHGDQLCTRDWAYRVTRTVIRSQPVRLAWRSLPPALAGNLASGFRSHSRRAIRRKPEPTLGISDDALGRLFRRGADAVVCGHVHRQEHRRVEGPGWRGDLYTLPDWERGQPHIVVDEQGIRFREELRNGR